jgi:hypothetical protein
MVVKKAFPKIAHTNIGARINDVIILRAKTLNYYQKPDFRMVLISFKSYIEYFENSASYDLIILE